MGGRLSELHPFAPATSPLARSFPLSPYLSVSPSLRLTPLPAPLMKTNLLLLVLCTGLLPAQQPAPSPLPPTALQSLSTFGTLTGREKVIGLVEVSGKAGMPTPAAWNIVIWEPRSPTKLAEFVMRGLRLEDRGPNTDFYPLLEPAGFFDLAKVEVDCAGAFRIADREAGVAMIGFDMIDYRLRCREFSDEPVWVLTLRSTAGTVKGIVTLSAKSGKILRTVWQRPGINGRLFPDDSAVPVELRPPVPVPLPPPVPLPDPFPAAARPGTPDPASPLPDPIPPDPDPALPPPPPLPPPGAPPPVPNIVPD